MIDPSPEPHGMKTNLLALALTILCLAAIGGVMWTITEGPLAHAFLDYGFPVLLGGFSGAVVSAIFCAIRDELRGEQ